LKPITIFRGTYGLNTKIDPARLGKNGGVLDLAVAADVDVSDTGRLSRRKGYTKQTTSAAHSLFCEQGPCLYVSGTGLYELHADYSSTLLATVTENARMNYAEINGRVYYLNGYEKGYIQDSGSHTWEKGTYYGPDTDRVLSDPPIGTIVRHYRNRMYIAQKNVLWFSEPGAFGAFDLARGFVMYASDIRMVRPVEDGIFVSSSRNTYFLKGSTPLEFVQLRVAPYPAVEGTDAPFSGALIFGQEGASIMEGPGIAAMWLSEEGVCYGGPNGFYNVTLDKIADMPTGLTRAGLVHKGKYVGLIDP
jgi:hypothetical protein